MQDVIHNDSGNLGAIKTLPQLAKLAQSRHPEIDRAVAFMHRWMKNHPDLEAATRRERDEIAFLECIYRLRRVDYQQAKYQDDRKPEPQQTGSRPPHVPTLAKPCKLGVDVIEQTYAPLTEATYEKWPKVKIKTDHGSEHVRIDKLTGQQLAILADDFAGKAKGCAKSAKFYRKLSDKAGGAGSRTQLGTCITVDQYDALRRSVFGGPEKVATAAA